MKSLFWIIGIFGIGMLIYIIETKIELKMMDKKLARRVNKTIKENKIILEEYYGKEG